MRQHVLVAVLACLLLVTSSLAAPAAPEEAGGLDRLQRLRDDLVTARDDLAALDRAVAAATTELDETEARLAAANADLTAVRADLAEAAARWESAREAAAIAAEELAAANAVLTAARDLHDAQGSALAVRVRNMWKYGGADPGALMLEGLARSDSLHDVTMTMRTVQSLVTADHALAVEATTAARTEARARTAVTTAEEQTRATASRAAADHARVEALEARQAALVDSIDHERSHRQGVLDALAADRAVTDRLVARLDDQVASLAGALLAALLASNPDARFDGPPPAWAAGLPPRGRELSPAIAGAAEAAGVDGRLFAAVVWSESAFHPAAVSHAGAIGLAQLMPGTAAGLRVDAWDPLQNLVGGARYLRVQLERFGSADLALAAYNAGPGRVEAAGRRIPAITETQVYVLRVLERYERLAAFG